MLRAGFVGLGDQGAPMARRIVDAGFPLTVWARRPASLEPFSGTAAAVADDLVALGRQSDVVGVCVVDDEGVRSVVLGPHGLLAGMAPGGIIAVHSTVHPRTCAEVAGQAVGAGVAVLDAPVSGGGRAAAARKLLVLVGGDEDVVGRAMPVLRTYGDPVLHVGPPGSGALAKLINNALMTAQLGLADDGLRLGAALGLDPGTLGAALLQASGASFSLGVRSHMPEGLEGFVAERLLRKDLDLLRSVARDDGLDLGALGAAAESALGRMHAARR
jgi:3-hydroxyisobutyrate dehydrogenase-like beta-hydroxyacid dehydrogenase